MASSATVHILVKFPSGETYPIQVHVRPTWFELVTTVRNVLPLPCVQENYQLSFLRDSDAKQEYLFSNAYVDTVELVEGDVLLLLIDSATYRVSLDHSGNAMDYTFNPPRSYNLVDIQFKRLSSDGNAKRYTTLLYDEQLGGVIEFTDASFEDVDEVIVPDDSHRYTIEDAIDRQLNIMEPISHMARIALRESFLTQWKEWEQGWEEEENFAMTWSSLPMISMRPKRER